MPVSVKFKTLSDIIRNIFVAVILWYLNIMANKSDMDAAVTDILHH